MPSAPPSIFLAAHHDGADCAGGRYEREQYVAPARGKAFVYRLDLWHHGCPVAAGRRRAYNVVFHSQTQAATAISGGRWAPGFWRNGYDTAPSGFYGVPEALFCHLSPHQRTATGFPGVGDAFFTAEHLKLLVARLPGFDPRPYLEGYTAAARL